MDKEIICELMFMVIIIFFAAETKKSGIGAERKHNYSKFISVLSVCALMEYSYYIYAWEPTEMYLKQ